MWSARVHKVRQAVPWIGAIIALGGIASGATQPAPDLTHRGAAVVVAQASGGTCVATAVVRAGSASPDTSRAPLTAADATRQRRSRLLEWGIQTVRVLDAVLQAMRALGR